MKREEPEDEAAWREIVENYGKRVLADEPAEPVEEPVEEPVPPPAPPEQYDAELDPFLDDPDDPEDRFVPPVPPPMPRPAPDRLVAWLGVFLAPAILLTFVILGYRPPELVGWLLVGWFVGGFLYLVVKMPGSPRDPFDDGAQI